MLKAPPFPAIVYLQFPSRCNKLVHVVALAKKVQKYIYMYIMGDDVML